VNAHENLHLAC